MLLDRACLTEEFGVRQKTSDTEIEANRSRNTKIKMRGRLAEAMFKGGLIAVVWLIVHHDD